MPTLRLSRVMDREKRGHARVKVSVPIELTPEGSQAPLRAETADLSARGCYIEMLFTLPVGTPVKVTLQAGDSTILTTGKIMTRDPNVIRSAGTPCPDTSANELAQNPEYELFAGDELVLCVAKQEVHARQDTRGFVSNRPLLRPRELDH
jgi:PilZ domain-containing protein